MLILPEIRLRLMVSGLCIKVLSVKEGLLASIENLISNPIPS
jgi:hypothetical protein